MAIFPVIWITDLSKQVRLDAETGAKKMYLQKNQLFWSLKFKCTATATVYHRPTAP